MSLLGKDSLTITDITDVNPIRLDLASSKPIYQTKRAGEKYEPDYTDKDSPLIITPSLYLGPEEVSGVQYQNSEDEKYISFFINGKNVTELGEEKGYVLDTDVNNNKPILKITKNLTENILVEVTISNITDERTRVTYNSISENLSFYLLSYDSSGYTAFINSEDGRYDFSADNPGPIKLIAHLYLGNTDLNNVTYIWSRSSGAPITAKTKELTIERSNIHSHENFVCKMTYEGVTYTATCAIDDRTDLYTSTIISDTSLVMTPSFKTSTFTCKIFKNQEEVTGGDIKYSWIYYENGSTDSKDIGGNTKDIKITLGNENMPKNSFTLYCTATIDEKFITVAYLPVSYSVSYTPILTPKTIFIPANSDGSYKGEGDTIETTLTFFLQGDDGKPIDAELSNFSINGVNYTPTKVNNKYSILFSLAVEDFNSLETSSMFELSYKYKEKDFNEEFYIVKSVQGSAGRNGINGASYSLILSNDYHRFAGKEVYADEGQEVSIIISFYKGNEEMPLEVIKIGNETVLATEYKTVFTGLKAKLDKIGSTTGKMITFITTARELKEGGTIPIEIKVNLNGEEKIFATVFQYDINYEGNSYFLSFTNGTSISYLPSKDTFTPNKLEFYAYYRQNGLGENKLYTDGRVYVSIDGEEKKYLSPKTTGGAYYEYTEVSNIKNSITFYLYNSLTKTEGLKDEYLMDRETIPVITSLEGAEIGGDNLLRFTRTLQEWDIQNSNQDTISINKDIDANYATFNFNTSTGDTADKFYKACALASPKIYIGKELENKTFCISFYFKNDSENYFDNPPFTDGNIHASIYAYNEDNKLEAKGILYISNGSLNNAKVENEEIIEKGKWVRVYQTFNLDTFSNDTLANATHYIIKIMGVIRNGSSFTYNFSIKKPKLEVGNTLTSWSMATNDILFENLNVDLDDLDSRSLVEVLNNQIANLNVANGNISTITNNMANGNISFSIETAEGTKRFANLEAFSNYLNTNINQIIENANNKYTVINNTVNALISNNGNFFELKNNIELGFEDEKKFEPYLLFKVVGGPNNDKIRTMRLTTEKLSFYSGENELAYFGSNSMTIKRARVSEGYYLGSDDTGYLVMKTTPQGCAFVWQSTEFEQ